MTSKKYTRQQARAEWRRIVKQLRSECKAAALRSRAPGGAAPVRGGAA